MLWYAATNMLVRLALLRAAKCSSQSTANDDGGKKVVATGVAVPPWVPRRKQLMTCLKRIFSKLDCGSLWSKPHFKIIKKKTYRH